MAKVKKKHGYKRGYPVALLVGFEVDHAVLWHVFSHVAKLYATVQLRGRRTDERTLYSFHESVVDALRPMLKEGVRSVVVTGPMKTTYAADFLNHTRKHHAYLVRSKGSSRAAFAELVGSADQPHNVAELVKTKKFRKLIAETTSGEADHIVNALEKNLSSIDNSGVALFSLKEIEDVVYNQEGIRGSRTAYLMLTDKYLADSEDKNRAQRLLQISRNRKVETTIVKVETQAGKRISQFGGIVFFTMSTR